MNSKFVILLLAIYCTCAFVNGLPTQTTNDEDDYESNTATRAACVLPMERGICRARMPRWGYDPEKKECVSFYYGGCYGNDNNFMTKEECVKVCKGV